MIDFIMWIGWCMLFIIGIKILVVGDIEYENDLKNFKGKVPFILKVVLYVPYILLIMIWLSWTWNLINK